jgi:DNA repair ATPase RecN
MVDLWSYQNKEISAAHLVPGEDEALETEKRVLANSEKLYAASMGAFDQLYEGGASAEVALRAALRNVEELARYDARFTDAVQQLTSARAILGDVSSTLRDYAEGIDASPERLAEIEDRLALLDRLKRKYGHTIDEVIAVGEDVARKLSEVEDRDELLKELRKALDEAAKAYQVEASALSTQRKAAAAKLAKLAEAQINSLAMKVKFEVAVYSPEDLAAIEASSAEDAAFSKTSGRTEKGIVSSGALSPEVSAALKGQDSVALKGHSLSRDAEAAVSSATGIAALKGKAPVADKQSFVTGHDFSRAENVAKLKGALAPAGSPSENHQSCWTSTGWDEVECRIATNPGEPLKPLHEIASGGEMSRVMLALKVAVEENSSKTNKKTTPRTLVFDEIDIGIGGRAAEAVGQKLKSLGRGQQVLCVTHLPQIAAFADQHLVVEKHVSEGRTRTRIRVLDDRARTHEVARMLSGATVTETSLQHAAQMIASSR